MWNVEQLFRERELYLQRFTRKDYPGSFREFCQIFHTFLAECDKHYDTHLDVKLLCDGVAGEICRYVADDKEKQTFKKRREKEEWQQKWNTFIVAYLFPAILEYHNPYYKQLAETIEIKWAEVFDGNTIKAANFETLNGGFRKNAFGL